MFDCRFKLNICFQIQRRQNIYSILLCLIQLTTFYMITVRAKNATNHTDNSSNNNSKTEESDLSKTILYSILGVIFLLIVIVALCICHLLQKKREIIIVRANPYENEGNDNSKKSIPQVYETQNNDRDDTHDEHKVDDKRVTTNNEQNMLTKKITPFPPVLVCPPSVTASEAAFLGPSEKSITDNETINSPPLPNLPSPPSPSSTTSPPTLPPQQSRSRTRDRSRPLIVRAPETSSAIEINKSPNESPQTNYIDNSLTNKASPHSKQTKTKNRNTTQEYSHNTSKRKRKTSKKR